MPDLPGLVSLVEQFACRRTWIVAFIIVTIACFISCSQSSVPRHFTIGLVTNNRNGLKNRV